MVEPTSTADVSADINTNNTQQLNLTFEVHSGDTNLTQSILKLKTPFNQLMKLHVSNSGRTIEWDGMDLKYMPSSESNILHLQPNRPEDAQ